MAVQDESAMWMRRRQQQVTISEPDGEASAMSRLVSQCGEAGDFAGGRGSTRSWPAGGLYLVVKSHRTALEIVEGRKRRDNRRAYHHLAGVIGTAGRVHVRLFYALAVLPRLLSICSCTQALTSCSNHPTAPPRPS